jgi:aspartyl-tRNA(Asn)/glutamyl-tRNA(Gln) amidotransferase subunit C
MPEPLSAEHVRRIARLSRLTLTDAEVEEYRVRLSAVLASFERLRELDLSGVEPLTNVADAHSRLDPDEPGTTLPTRALLEMAPDTFDSFVKVPKVVGGGGSA